MNWHPYAEEWPLLKDVDPAGWEAFKAGIKATKGVADNPIRFRVAEGKVQGLDGRNRFLACKELRIKPAMKKVRVKDDQATDYIDRWNLHRRHHMTPDLRQKLVAKRRELGQGTREIADALGVYQSTVVRDLARSGDADASPDPQNQAEQPHSAPKTVIGQDGKAYPASRPKLAPAVKQRIDAGAISPKRQADFDELTHRQQEEALVLFDGGTKLLDALKRVVDGDAGDQGASSRVPKNGRPEYDWKLFDQGFGTLLRQVEEIGRRYSASEWGERQRLEDDLKAWKKRVREFYESVAKRAAPQE